MKTAPANESKLKSKIGDYDMVYWVERKISIDIYVLLDLKEDSSVEFLDHQGKSTTLILRCAGPTPWIMPFQPISTHYIPDDAIEIPKRFVLTTKNPPTPIFAGKILEAR